MPTPTIEPQYRTAVSLTVTNLHSLAASQTLVSGWLSGVIDNTTDLDDDKWVSGELVSAASNNQVGEIRLYAITMLDDTNWPGIFSSGTVGTEGAGSASSAEQRESGLRMIWSTATNSSASKAYEIPKTSLASFYGGRLPKKLALFIIGNATTTTTAQLAASGNQVTVTGVQDVIPSI